MIRGFAASRKSLQSARQTRTPPFRIFAAFSIRVEWKAKRDQNSRGVPLSSFLTDARNASISFASGFLGI